MERKRSPDHDFAHMDLITSIQSNLLSPAVLFFCLGIFAALTRSDLKFPEALYNTLTIYLLTAIGFKGGVAVSEAGFGVVWLPAVAAMGLGVMVPSCWGKALFRGESSLRMRVSSTQYGTRSSERGCSFSWGHLSSGCFAASEVWRRWRAFSLRPSKVCWRSFF